MHPIEAPCSIPILYLACGCFRSDSNGMKWPSPEYLSLVPRLQNIRNQSKACLFILARNLRNLRASENGCIRGNCDFLASAPHRTVLISQGPATSMYDCYVCSFSLSKEIWWWITSASEAWHFGNQHCESHKVGMAFEENEESRRQEIQGPGARHDRGHSALQVVWEAMVTGTAAWCFAQRPIHRAPVANGAAIYGGSSIKLCCLLRIFPSCIFLRSAPGESLLGCTGIQERKISGWGSRWINERGRSQRHPTEVRRTPSDSTTVCKGEQLWVYNQESEHRFFPIWKVLCICFPHFFHPTLFFCQKKRHPISEEIQVWTCSPRQLPRGSTGVDLDIPGVCFQLLLKTDGNWWNSIKYWYIYIIHFLYTLYILYIYIIYTLYILYIYYIYTLYILYIYTLYIYFIYTLYILYIYIYTLYILFIYFIYTLYILYIHFIYTLYILYIYILYIYILYI